VANCQLYRDSLNMVISYQVSFAVLESTDKLLTDFYSFNLCSLFGMQSMMLYRMNFKDIVG